MTSVAKGPCITRKISGRIRASPGSPMDMPKAKRMCHRCDDGVQTGLWRSKIALRVY